MDSITQGVLGAAIGVATFGNDSMKKGAIAGAIIATIPDLDVLLYLFYDSYEMLSIHRGMSHSILFSVIGAFIIAFILSKIKWFHNTDLKLLILFSWLTLFTHILLDTFTAYGTQLLSPFSDKRLGFDSINVVDPLYTIPLIIGLILSIWIFETKPQSSRYNKWGLIISSLYLVFTLINKERINAVFENRLSAQQIEYASLLTMPVGMANCNWYGVAKSTDSIYMQKYSVFGNTDDSFHVFPVNDQYLNDIDNEVAEKMRWFAKGFYTVEKENEKIRIYNLQVDMRGIVQNGDKKAPTIGYFELADYDGVIDFSSGSIK